MGDTFLHWFAGFVDGEGHFQVVSKNTTCQQFYTALTIMLRDDDLDILLVIQEKLGMGGIYRHPARKTSQPVAIWKIGSIADCRKMVEILDDYPLRTKKQRDYGIWREAVLENVKPVVQRDLRRLKYLHDKIKLVRCYDAPIEEEEPPVELQLRLSL